MISEETPNVVRYFADQLRFGNTLITADHIERTRTVRTTLGICVDDLDECDLINDHIVTYALQVNNGECHYYRIRLSKVNKLLDTAIFVSYINHPTIACCVPSFTLTDHHD